MPTKGEFTPDFSQEKDFSAAADGTVFYEEAFPPFGLVIESERSVLELIVGDDFWRWTNAERIGGTSRFAVVKKDGALHFTWQIFTLKPDTEMPAGRNWRLTWAASWHGRTSGKVKKTAFKSAFNLNSADWQEASRAVLSVRKTAKKKRNRGGGKPGLPLFFGRVEFPEKMASFQSCGG